MLTENNEDDVKRKQAEAFRRFQQSQEMSPDRRPIPDGKYESVVDLVLEAENPQVARLYTYDAVGRWIDRGDDWSARMAIEDASKRLTILSPEKAFLAGEEWNMDNEKFEQLSDSLTVIKDLNLFFIQWYGFYRGISASGKVFQAAFAQESEFMTPEKFGRIYGDLKGFKEGDKEWKSVAEQINTYVVASIYLGLQSDPRWKDELKWFKGGKGFKKLFPNESDELDWIRRYKLKTLPNSQNDFAPYKGKRVEDLTPEQLIHLDSEPAMNRYADPGDGASVKAVREMLLELMTRGKYQANSTMAKQAEFAFDLGDKTMKIFGLDAMYGTRGKEFKVRERATGKISTANYVELLNDGTDKYEILDVMEVVNEGYPWNQTIVDATHPGDKVAYNRASSYFVGAKVWEWFAPKNIMVDFLHMMPVSDEKFPESKFYTRSAFELLRDGYSIGDIMKKESSVGDWSFRAYLIRILFTYKEDFGAILALTNELERGKQSESLISGKFLENVEKSIHIVCRNWLVTGGRFEQWFEDHKSEIDQMKTRPDFVKKLHEKYANKRIKIELSDKILETEAAEKVLKEYVTKEKNRWKAIVWLTGLSFTGTVRTTEREDLIRVAKRVGFLDPSVLDASLDFKFNQDDDTLKTEMKRFIELAASSVN